MLHASFCDVNSIKMRVTMSNLRHGLQERSAGRRPVPRLRDYQSNPTTGSGLGFNGAAPFRARRSGPSSLHHPCPPPSFNGAAPFRARRLHGARSVCAAWARFNGAAPFRARRSPDPDHVKAGLALASTGPRLFGRGDWRLARPVRSSSNCFNGAAPFRARR